MTWVATEYCCVLHTLGILTTAILNDFGYLQPAKYFITHLVCLVQFLVLQLYEFAHLTHVGGWDLKLKLLVFAQVENVSASLLHLKQFCLSFIN